ncbi:MAG: SDR family oxidoreductase [Methylobacteriaceae bacterium]|nr:SDR family oxidoreductase [Methylobacteriaceae bacterium]
MKFAGRRALITGGGSGVGAALARGFAAAGAEVTIAGRRREALQRIATETGARALVCDVTQEASVEALFRDAGPCDIVIANAGSADTAPFPRTSLDLWRAMLDVNLTGAFLTLRGGLAQMPERGRLIAIASLAGLKGYAYCAAYAAAKHGVVGMIRSLALEIATREITANAICPGFVDSDMTGRSIAAIVEKTGRDRAAAQAALVAGNPQRRLIDPDEIVAAALWLASDAARSVNGQAIAISGGEA